MTWIVPVPTRAGEPDSASEPNTRATVETTDPALGEQVEHVVGDVAGDIEGNQRVAEAGEVA